MAERVGFEPTDLLQSHDFESCSFNRTRTPLRKDSAERSGDLIAEPARAQTCRARSWLRAACAEEIRQQAARLFGKQAFGEFDAMIESRVLAYPIQGNCSAGLGISGREYQALNPSLNQQQTNNNQQHPGISAQLNRCGSSKKLMAITNTGVSKL